MKKILNNKKKILKNILIEILCLVSITMIGVLLIGWYLPHNFLATNYQDWIYHAFRIESISRVGITSWNHIWSNGLNIWRSYQYIFHFTLMLLSKSLNLTAPQIMIYSTVFVFITLRLITYISLRLLKFNHFVALLATIVSYSFIYQWISISDFSVYLTSLFIPPIILLWKKTLKNKEYLYILSSVSGAIWLLHPIIGYSTTFLLGLTVLFKKSELSPKEIFLLGLSYLISFSPFLVPYLSFGYAFSNPYFLTSKFLKDTLKMPNYGLSTIFLSLLSLGWILTFFQTKKIQRWTKILLLFSTLYLIAIILAVNGYLPVFFNKIQISRGVIYIATVLPFVFADIFKSIYSIYRSRLTTTLAVVLLAITIVNSLVISSPYMANPVDKLEDPVNNYFTQQNLLPTGSVFIDDVSKSSYFTKGKIRYARSYNEHLEPHPLSQRLKGLINLNNAYTSISHKQAEAIRNYSKVLGVEYIFVPQSSSLPDFITNENNENYRFEFVDSITAQGEVFSILRNTNNTAIAYLIKKDQYSLINKEYLPKPTLYTKSYIPWDKEVNNIANLINNQTLKPIKLQFVNPDQLIISFDDNLKPEDYVLIIHQSYDKGWQVQNYNLEIKPTSLRFMAIELNADIKEHKIILKNQWPRWFWPLQTFSIAGVITTIVVVTYYKKHKNK